MAETNLPQNTISRLLPRAMPCVLLAGVLHGCAIQPTQPPAQILLLGEVHDNPDGHQQRNAYLRKLVEGGWRPAIVMEQFDRENQSALTQAQANCADAQCVIQAAGGKRWEWPFYEPIIDLALRYKLPLLAGNVSRADAAIAMKHGFAALLGADIVTTFKLDALLPTDLFDGQRSAIETGHCGKLPTTLAQGMLRAQVARDVWMAKMLLDHAKPDAVLIAGNGHVRKDLGVPRWLPATARAHTQVHGYLERSEAEADGSAAFDMTHRVPDHVRPDPCLSFAAPPTASQPTR
jgi:uncharacterized iron-regulated protein